MTTLSRKSFLHLSAATVATPTFAKSRVPRTKPLNVLFITTDQEQPWSKIPHTLGLRNHERMLEKSVHFENWTSNTSPCSPARSILYTGQHLQKTRITDNPGIPPWPNSLDTAIPTMGTLFKEAGYQTIYKGKWHLSEIVPDSTKDYSRGLQPYGFDHYQAGPEAVGLAWDGYKHDPEVAADAVNWLMTQGKNADKPWLLTVNFLNPHDIMFFDATGVMNDTRLPTGGPRSRLNPRPTTKPYGGAKLNLPKNFTLNRDGELEAHRIFREDNEMFLGVIADDDKAGWQNFVNYYADCLHDVDTHLGTVLDGLERAGLADSTVVVFTADHGEMAASHGQRQKGPFIYTENLGVPMMIRHPDVRGGSKTEALGSAVDVVPTLLSLAGVDMAAVRARHPEMIGVDVSNVVNNHRAASSRAAVLLAYSAIYSGSPDVRRKRSRVTLEPDPVKRAQLDTQPPYHVDYQYRTFMRGLYDGRYRFARYFAPRDHHMPTDWANLKGRNDLELYDTKTDPLEMNNLALEGEARMTDLLRLNAALNELIKAEVGLDDGSHMPGSLAQWRI
ncbi:MAG: sulfatase-like hydrolase/transferase [Rhodospirillaceae bacterium]|nr:sulfatase-like hydrolase/transferase [Rhodospirillaceae bacterium]